MGTTPQRWAKAASQRAARVGAHPTGSDQVGSGGGDQGLEHGVELLELRFQALHPSGQFAECELGSAEHSGGVSRPEPGRRRYQLR